MPHSQCSLRENSKFLQNFRPKNNTLREKILTKILIKYYITLQNFHKRKFPKLMSKMQVNFVNEAPELQASSLF